MRTVPRNFPTILGWDQQLLRTRQKAEIIFGSFGTGYPTKRIIPPISMFTSLPDTTNVIEDSQVDALNASGWSLIEQDSSQLHAGKILESAKKMHDSISTFFTLLQQSPTVMLDDAKFRQIIESTHRLLGANETSKVQASTSAVQANPKSTEEVYGYVWTENCEAALLEIEAMLSEKGVFDKFVNDYPSFSLGLTQLDNDELSSPEGAFRSGVRF